MIEHAMELSVQDELEVTKSEKTDRLDMSQATPSCLRDTHWDKM